MPIDVATTSVLLTASVGVAEAPADGQSPESLLQRSELAMFASKRSGGDRTQRFSIEMDAEASRQAEIRADIAQAIRNSDFSLDYQAVFQHSTGQVAGVEALVRWVRDGERITAGRFIDSIEQTGQI